MSSDILSPSMLNLMIYGPVALVMSIGAIVTIVCVCKRLRLKKKKSKLMQNLESRRVPPTGISKKTGNYHLNAPIQATAASDVFVFQLKFLKSISTGCKSLNLLLLLLSGLNDYGNIKEIRRKNTVLMKKLIKSINLDRSSIQDAYLLLSEVISSIENNLRGSVATRFQMPLKLILAHRTSHENNFQSKIQDHFGLSIGLCGEYSNRPGVPIEYLIEQHLSPTIFNNDPHKTIQTLFYQQAPDVLLVHILANKWDNERKEVLKSHYFINYGKNMTLTLDIVTDLGVWETSKAYVHYNLKAIVVHIGNIVGGHYVTYRDYLGGWFMINNDVVAEAEFNTEIPPYLMVYEKVNLQ